VMTKDNKISEWMIRNIIKKNKLVFGQN
jgi:hypothetical protein